VLADSEAQTSKQEKLIEELTKRLEEVQAKADEAERLKDQVDEYKHAAERLRKVEAQNEKYRKKLDEGAEARQMLQTLEDQNLDLLEKNSQLEEEYRKVSAFQGLMDTYKAQIADLENKNRVHSKELQETRYKLDESRRRLQAETDEVERGRDSITLLEERIQELEVSGRKRLSLSEKKGAFTNGKNGALNPEDEMDDQDAADLSGIANEMDDAVRGTTTTQLKLEIRRLRRELQAAQSNKADASKIDVLQHLLDESQKMKARYEQDYLAEHREKLVALGKLEEIRAGKSDTGDGCVFERIWFPL
jgi:protein HOOK3